MGIESAWSLRMPRKRFADKFTLAPWVQKKQFFFFLGGGLENVAFWVRFCGIEREGVTPTFFVCCVTVESFVSCCSPFLLLFEVERS